MGNSIEVNEYSTEGFGTLHEQFSHADEAIAWVNTSQAKADENGNPTELCWEVYLDGKLHYSTFSSSTALLAAA